MKKILLCFAIVLGFSLNLCAKDIAGHVRTYKVGKFAFLALKDIETNMGKEILLQPMAPIVAKMMAQNQNPSSINGFLLKSKEQNILIDTGIGADGKLLKNLSETGVEPKDVNIVIITHMHGDHIGGLVSPDGKKVFVNAVVYVNVKELEYWTTSDTRNPQNSAMAKNVQAVYGDKIKTFNWGDNIIPEIKTIAAPGHTPGHTVFEINSEDDKMLVIADLVHVLKVQMADPNMAVTFDSNPRDAVDTRKKIFKDISKNKTRVAGMHIPFPGVGTITETTGGAYEFSPSVSIN